MVLVRVFVALNLILVGATSIAAVDSLQKTSKKIEKSSTSNARSKWGAILTAGMESRTIRTADGQTDFAPYNSGAIGVRYDQWLGFYEFATPKTEATGNTTLNVTVRSNQHLLWGAYEANDWVYLGVGLGATTKRVETRLSGVESVEEGRTQMTGGALLGIRVPLRPLWLGVEARVISTQNEAIPLSYGGLVRFGLYF